MKRPPKSSPPPPSQPRPAAPPPVRLSLRVAGLLLAIVPWIAVPSWFSDDALGESKSLAAAAGVTLCLFLMLREQRRDPASSFTLRGWFGDPFRAGAALALFGLLAAALFSPVPGLGLLAASRNLMLILFAVSLSLLRPREPELRWVLGCLFSVMGLESLVALGQYFAPNLMRAITPWGPADTGRGAIVGTLANPEYLAGWLASGLAATLIFLWRSISPIRPIGPMGPMGPIRILAAASALLTLSVIFLSGGRGAALSVAGALALAALFLRPRTHSNAECGMPNAEPGKKSRRPLLIGLTSLIGLILLLSLIWAAQKPELRRGGLPARLVELANPYSPSIRHRLGLLAVTSRIIIDHPFLGVGPGRYGWAYGEEQARLAREEQGVGFWMLGDVLTGNFVGEAHCDPLQWWAEYGLFPFLGLTLMIAAALSGAVQGLRAAGEGSAAGAALWAAGAAIAINMWVAFPLQRPVRALTFWLLLGLLASLSRPSDRS